MKHLRSFTLEELLKSYPTAKEEMMDASFKALGYPDNPRLPKRTPEKKLADGFWGKAAEIATKYCTGLQDHPDKYQDLLGQVELDGFKLDGIIEVKSLKEPSDHQARLSKDRHFSHSTANWFIFWVIDRKNELIIPYSIGKIEKFGVLEHVHRYK